MSLPRPIGRGRRARFAAVLAVGIGQAAGAIGLALATQRAFDELVVAPASGEPVQWSSAAFVGGLMVASVLVMATCRALERIAAEGLGQHYVAEVRHLLFEHVTAVPARDLAARRSGAMLMRFVGDLQALRSWVSLGIARLAVATTLVITVLCVLAFLAPAIAISVAVVLAAGALATAIVSRSIVATSRRARRRRARLSGEISERLSSLATVQAARQARRERRRMRRHSDSLVTAMLDKARAIGLARGVAEAAAGLATIAVVLAGAIEVARGASTPGTIVGALAVLGLLTGSLRDLGRVAEYAAGARVAKEAALRFLELPRMETGSESLPGRGGGEIELRDVALTPAVHDVSAVAPAGSLVVVVGSNGAGKSSLAALLARLAAPTSGSVLVDGVDLADLGTAELGRAVAIVSPDLPLLAGTVQRNVTYRMPRADEGAIADVVAACDLGTVLDALPEGWDAQVGERGTLLSSGQRTRIELARAMLGNPRLLVLDEADAHLDERTRTVLDRAIRTRRGSSTTIVVTHRDDLVRDADQVWRMHEGRLTVESLTAVG